MFEWFGQIRAAEQAHEPRQREIWTRWALLGGSRHEEAVSGDGLEPPQGSREPEINPTRPMVGSYYCG